MPSKSKPRRNKDESWSITLRFFDADKEPQRICVTLKGASRGQVVQKGDEKVNEYHKGEYCPWGSVNGEPVWSQVNVYQSMRGFVDARKHSWSPSTQATWEPVFTRFADLLGPNLRMSSLTEAMVQALLSDQKYSWYTAEKYKGRLNSWLKWAYENQHTPNLIQIVNTIRKHEKRVSYITWDELQLIKQEIASDARSIARRKHCYPSNTMAWMIRFLDFMFIFGLRRQEALDLRVKDVDTRYKLIMIRNTKGRRDESIPYGEVEPAKRIIDRQLFLLRKAGLLHADRRLFLHSQGDRVSKAFKKYVRRALPKHRHQEIKMHSIRHGTATYLLQYMSLSEVQAWMRHQDTRTTTGYAKIIQKNLSREAGKALNALGD